MTGSKVASLRDAIAEIVREGDTAGGAFTAPAA